jgi:magnesium transporter
VEDQRTDRPWEKLADLLDSGVADPVRLYLQSLPSGQAARALDRLDDSERSRVLELLDAVDAAELLEDLSDVQALSLVQHLDPAVVAPIVQELPSNEQADILGHLESAEAEAILTRMEPAEAEEVRSLVQYPDDVAGGLMITEYLAYRADQTVEDVVLDLREHKDEYRNYEIQYAYVIDDGQRLQGVLRLRDLLLAQPSDVIDDIALLYPITLNDKMPLAEIEDIFDKHPYFGIPVVDDRQTMVGVVRREALQEALAERSDSDYRKSQGIVGGDELRTMPLLLRSRRRMAWLSINIVLNIAAASIIAFYQETLTAVIALAVFLPIISDMSGCSGNQAVAVSIRELTLGILRPTDLLRVWFKETSVGLLNGLLLGLLLAAVAWIWQGNPYLGLVVGVALTLNTLVAVSIGGLVPLALRRFNLDPALASGPILTTVTDMCGFFLILSLASLMLPKLT